MNGQTRREFSARMAAVLPAIGIAGDFFGVPHQRQ